MAKNFHLNQMNLRQNLVQDQMILLQKNRRRCYNRQALQVHQKNFL
nr:MAG TPA: hypothetical protein [Crassvirales sp.]